MLAPLANRDHLDQVLVTFGLILVFDELAVIVWGKEVQPAAIPALLAGSVHLGDQIVYPLYRLVLGGIGLLCAVGLYLLVAKTRLGMIVRAGSFDRTMVRALGVNVTPIFSLVFGIGAALAAFAGLLAAPILSVSPGMGDKIIIIAFVVIVIGGIGSIKGAFVGSLLVGLFNSFGKILFPSVSSLVIYALMAAVLVSAAARPVREGVMRPLGIISGIVLAGVLSMLPFLHSAYLITHTTRILIYTILAMSLDLLVGYCGLVSLGHAAFFGISAYTAAMLAAHAGIGNVLIALPLSLLSAAAGALVIGLFTLRTSGIYFIMATLAFGQMLFFLANDSDVFGGSDGLLLLNHLRASIGSIVLFDLSQPVTCFYTALIAAVATMIGLSLLVRSPFGRILQGIKSNEQRMRALGYPVERYKLGCFVIGGTLSGLAGYLYLMLTSLADPSILDWTHSTEMLLMVILGGLGTLIGPAAGALVLIELIDQSSAWTEHWKLIVGILVIVMTLFARGGLAGLFRILRSRRREASVA